MTATTEHRRYGGQSAQERDDERRQKLRETALNLFGTEGYAAVPVERICSTAKVSTKHFYQLYGNKEDVLIDTYGAMTAESFAAAGRSLVETDGQHMAERLPAAISAYLAPILADPRAARLGYVEIVGVSPRVEAVRLGFRDQIVALIEREAAAAVEKGEVAPRDFRFHALSFIGAINVVVHDWSLHADRAEHDAATDLEHQLCALAVQLLTSDPSPLG
ncbi:MAG: TetR/AcrR family transcriptional regulator [Aeromicrobium sp.]